MSQLTAMTIYFQDDDADLPDIIRDMRKRWLDGDYQEGRLVLTDTLTGKEYPVLKGNDTMTGDETFFGITRKTDGIEEVRVNVDADEISTVFMKAD